MTRRLVLAVLLPLAVAALLVSLPTDSRAAFDHISLVRSAPAKDTVLTEPLAEIRLWFSGVPRQGATSIRLLDSAGEAVSSVHVMDVTPDAEDGRAQFAQVHGPLASGRYTVSWATTAQDGASAKGEIPFTVRTQ